MNSERWPFLLRVVACFFLVEGATQLVGVISAGMDASEARVYWLQEGVPLLALVVFHFLIGGLLLLRSSAGRTWAMIFLVAHLGLLGVVLVLEVPGHWSAVGIGGRIRLLLSIALEVGMIAYLARPRVKEFLHR